MKTVALFVLALMCSGCASTPLTGAAVQAALRDAQKAGWVEVQGKYIPPEAAAPLMAARGEGAQAAIDRLVLERELAERHGVEALSVARKFRPWAVGLAQVGDGALIAGAVAALGWAVDQAVSDGGGDYNQTIVRADRGSVVMIGNRDGNHAAGGYNIAEEEP